MEELLRETLVSLPDPLMIIGVEAKPRIIFANPALRSLLELSEDGVPELEEVWPDICLSSCASSGEVTTRLRSLRGDSFPVKLGVSKFTSGHALVRVLAMVHSEDDAFAYHSQRLETLGILAGGFAHDFNNLLTGILGHITYLRTILPATGSHIESLQAIQEGARRASFMTREMLMFSKQEESDDESNTCDIRDIVVRTCTLLRGAVSPLYTLRYKIPEISIFVDALPSRMSQVIANLIINARDAVSRGGIIEVGLELVTNGDTVDRFFGTGASVRNRYVRLFVVDDGHGISQTVQDKIFDPFFSTKKGKGTGLGLTTVASIVRGCGGNIEIFSRESVGTSVSVYFPVSAQEKASGLEPSENEEAAESEQRDSGRVLVVDDEYLVRNVLSVSLQHLGFEVETAASGQEALELFAQHGSIFDVVILDMVMPHMSGEEVFEQLRDLDPEVRVIMVSGMCSQDSVNRITRQGGKFIRKPFTIHELSKVVRSTLHPTPHAA